MQAKSPFKPLAERVREFQYKTPTRFKSRPSVKPASNKKRSPITRAEVRHAKRALLILPPVRYWQQYMLAA